MKIKKIRDIRRRCEKCGGIFNINGMYYDRSRSSRDFYCINCSEDNQILKPYKEEVIKDDK